MRRFEAIRRALATLKQVSDLPTQGWRPRVDSLGSPGARRSLAKPGTHKDGQLQQLFPVLLGTCWGPQLPRSFATRGVLSTFRLKHETKEARKEGREGG
mmetsp:Transcript_17694/g.31212  ORF Transcript_17694/g.31212 Transcript_17694/m.31212 type:complete len:99 (+) Transcript_17694:1271-1567(+)